MSRRLLGTAALALVTTACASGNASFASRFITNGTPAVNLGGPELSSFASARRTPSPDISPAATSPRPSAGAASSSSLTSLEASSPRIRHALAALAASPTPERYLAVAGAYTAEGVRDKAFDYLTEGLRADHRSALLHDAVARAWRDWGLLDKALTAAHLAVYYAPDSPEAYNTLGTVLWALGQRAEATSTFEQATVLAPDAWYAWQNLCEGAMTAGHTLDATALCKRAAALRRQHRERRP